MELLKASAADIMSVVAIYDSVRNGEFCVWNEYYPTIEHATADLNAGCLYVLKHDGEVIGCASVEPVAEDDDLPFWKVNDGTHREVSRVAITPSYQGKGLSRNMMEMLMAELKKQGVLSIHLLAAKKNRPAFRTYQGIGFDVVGECYRYSADYFVCEKLL